MIIAKITHVEIDATTVMNGELTIVLSFPVHVQNPDWLKQMLEIEDEVTIIIEPGDSND